jgi:hypothetical protein
MKRMLAGALLTLTVMGLVVLSADARGFRLFNRCQPNCQPCYVPPAYNACDCQAVSTGNVVVSGGPNMFGSTNPPPVAGTKYTSGAEIGTILYGAKLELSKEPTNLSGRA